MDSLIRTLQNAQEHLRNARADAVEVHVKIQEVVDFIQYNETLTPKTGYMHPSIIQEIKQKLADIQKYIGAH